MRWVAYFTVGVSLAIGIGQSFGAPPKPSKDAGKSAKRMAVRLDAAPLSSFEFAGEVVDIAVSADGKLLAVRDRSHAITVLNVLSNQRLKSARMGGFPIVFSPTQPTLAVVSNHDVLLMNSQTLERGSVLDNDRNVIVSLSFSPDGRKLAGGSGTGTVIWDVMQGRIERVLPGNGEVCAFAPIGNLLATGGNEGIVHVWNADTMKPVMTFHEKPWNQLEAIASLAFSSDGILIAAGTGPGVSKTTDKDQQFQMPFYVWNLQTRKIVFKSLQQTNEANSVGVAFAPNRSLLATWGFEVALNFWNPDKPHENVRSLNQRPILSFASEASLRFFPDGQTLATIEGKTVKLWNVEKLLALENP